MGYKCKKKGLFRPTKRKVLVLTIFLAIFFLTYIFIIRNVNPILRLMSEERVRELTTIAINEAADQVLFETGFDKENLVELVRNTNGEVEMLRVNTLLINTVGRRMATLSQEFISELGEQGIGVPIGTLSGITFLAGMGPNINIKAIPIGAADIQFYSHFTSAGINQTRHKVFLIIETEVSVIIPGVRTITTQTELVLADSIIVGRVPDTVVNLGGIASGTAPLLNLNP